MDSKNEIFLVLKLLARITAGLSVMVLVWSCGSVTSLNNESGGGYLRIPFVRVLLDDTNSSVAIGAVGSFAIECISENDQVVYYSNSDITAIIENTYLVVKNNKGAVLHEGLKEINFLPRGKNNHLMVNNKKYRGLIKVLPNGGNVRIINVVYMEDYLKGVVPPEIGKRTIDEIEAVKAQAVAARTYAMAHLGQYAGQPYDMKSSIIDQLYQGYDIENKLVNSAIAATSGKVVFYNDSFVNTYYHSTCGGMTDDIDHVWERKETPYLKAVADSGACSWSKYYTWKEFFTEKQLRGRIEQFLSSDRGRDFKIHRIKNIIAKDRTPGGRVAVLIIKTDNETFRFKKDRIRWVIGRTSDPDLILPSDRFSVDIERDAADYVSGITFRGRGYGHGVGMCQCGAIGLARIGWNYNNILSHYYTDVELRELY